MILLIVQVIRGSVGRDVMLQCKEERVRWGES